MLNFIQSGAGTPVILVHGIAASLHDWAALTPALVGVGYRTVAVDLLGHGDSPHPTDPERFNMRAVYLSFEESLEKLGLDGPLHLVGHSLGGYISLRFALRFPERVRSLTLINPLYCVAQITPILRMFRRRPGLGSRLIKLAPGWMIDRALAWDKSNPDEFTPEARRQIALDYKRATPFFLNITRQVPDLTPELEKVRPPTLLIWGDQDRTLDPTYFPRMIVRLPNASHRRIKGSGHQPHIGKPEEVNQMVVQFIEGVDAEARKGAHGLRQKVV